MTIMSSNRVTSTHSPDAQKLDRRHTGGAASGTPDGRIWHHFLLFGLTQESRKQLPLRPFDLGGNWRSSLR
jgi:hypothetical protein